MGGVPHPKIIPGAARAVRRRDDGQGGSASSLGAVMVELLIGFPGILGEFRSVFIILFASRPCSSAYAGWTAITTIAVATGPSARRPRSVLDVGKGGIREVARGPTIHRTSMSLDARLGYLGKRMISPGDIDWSRASYALMSRLAYVDIFGSVIGVALVSPEQGSRQWSLTAWRTSSNRASCFKPRQSCRTPRCSSGWRAAMRPSRCARRRRLCRTWPRTMSTGIFPGMPGGHLHDRGVRGGGCRFFHCRAAAVDCP